MAAAVESAPDLLEEESAELDGYFSDEPLDPKPQYPILRETFETAVVITNLPKVPAAKVEKLTKVVTRLVSKVGELASCSDSGFTGVQLPCDENNNGTLGFAFVEFVTSEDASQALQVLQDYVFDKNHSLKVMPYARALQLKDVEEEKFEQPEPAPFVEKPNTSSWLEDQSQRDQFVTRFGKDTVVHWCDGRHEPIVDYDGSREKSAGVSWCDYYVQWSPKGSYFATLVPARGVILWGGSKYEKLMRFPAPGVEVVLFSPQENFLLISNNNRNDPNAIKVFSIQTGKLMRAFPLFPKDFIPEGLSNAEMQQIHPPPFQWSHDDKYLARMGKDLISIYETPNMGLLDRRSLIANGIHEFQFSPKANIIAYWGPEYKNQPAHVDLIELPSRNKLRQKNLFNVTKCSMVWQNDGNYLGVKVTRHTKSKKTLYNNIELFRLNEPGIPVEMLDIKDAVMAFAWEPKGSRFAMIHAENSSSTKVNVSFYDMYKKIETQQAKTTISNSKAKKMEAQILPEVNLIETLQGKQCNCVYWSPAGQNIILASLGDMASGQVEFYDVENKTIVVKEHYRANHVMWDPSGRTVATIVSQPIGGGHFKYAMDNGYILWSFQGKQIFQQSYESFYQFQWRPREDLLSPSEVKKVVKNLKKYEKEFDKADKELSRALRLEETKGKRALRTDFRLRMARLREIYRQQKETRLEIMDGYDSDDESNYVSKEVVVETVLNTKEEII
eukprot:CAMPEP_0184860688 /NCGR_PEP_ID=MMETSP0580-20130426/5538_1 /TAXON_ID=1118495 /ORGANISM="Dactyliosolen fragilissimus" /LENGTH=726 /DNA_ID=CAMNT_0027357897 /DNA_START=433 /DNA_END=2613 /DNA_ORIENTATION=+